MNDRQSFGVDKYVPENPRCAALPWENTTVFQAGAYAILLIERRSKRFTSVDPSHATVS